MDTVLFFGGVIGSLSFLAWIYLAIGRGRFWRTDQYLSCRSPIESCNFDWPSICVIVPARNEAEVLGHTLPTLLKQNYPGTLNIFLVDDSSEDNTSAIARRIYEHTDTPHRFSVIPGKPLAQGWTGKIWALQQGVQAADEINCDFFLFTDADIAHPPYSLQSLVSKAHMERLDLVSLMVQLEVKDNRERLLIPAFVYFFAKLYPFRWVNDPAKHTAAAAGGCLLLSRNALEQTGGLKQIAGALIDDCALAKQIKEGCETEPGRIWLGLSRELSSLRHYRGFSGIWRMVSRTAYSQLNYSCILLVVTVLMMIFIYLIPPFGTLVGIKMISANPELLTGWWMTSFCLMAWLIMAGTFLPVLKWYRSSLLFALLLPLAGGLYTLMTIDSAVKHRQGKGGIWKDRVYNLKNSKSKSNL